ncbi:putative receptor-like protein kinase-like [Dorcoceras hygrometricum]|uniref:Putative receptor-like protein kinase-like n=1 Tax=Dorcoceras hygrometricum TaxID=472368 RepID=A0A2Z7BSP9_9LAMI|nr:putative receptor-like protein kinase-like [Dorcoceras hygrometricum]
MATVVKFISLTLCLYIFPLSLVCAFSPTDHYLVNCGSGAAETVDPDHRVFTGDESEFLISTRTNRLVEADFQLYSSSPLYQTARGFTRPAHYVFPISDRGTPHLVRLHFHPRFTNSCCNCFEVEFHVVANGFLLLYNFRVPRGDGPPIIKEFVIPVDFGKLEITFIPSESSEFGFVNAIEVLSAPKDLIADVAQYVDSGKVEWIHGLSRNGFETVHRVNVGGPKVTPFNDSLWRTWVTDDKYLQGRDGSEKVHFGGRIQYQMGGASREVGPDNVYNTARIIKSSDDSTPKSNITLTFEVEKGCRYMVRMHFCDIASVSSGMIYFDVYVNGNLAYENLDLSDVTNRLLASPFYADFVVDEGALGNLVVSVGPSNMSLPHAVDGLVNGIEVWRMNNSMGSFGEEVSAEYVRASWRRGHTGVLLPLAAAVFLLLTASVFMVRKKNGHVGWSRLPVDVSETNSKFDNQFSSVKA